MVHKREKIRLKRKKTFLGFLHSNQHVHLRGVGAHIHHDGHRDRKILGQLVHVRMH